MSFDPEPSKYLWIVIAGGIASFITAFGIGANDVANAFASSVGSKALKLWQAVIIAAIFEFGGAVLLGAGVTSTIRQGIAKGNTFADAPELLMLAMLCADLGSGLWLLIATRFSLAVSTTHSIVGAIIGVFLVAGGKGAIDWEKVGLIVGSWFISPLLSGIVSAIIFFFVRTFLLRSENSLKRTMIFYPLLVALTFAINLFFVIYKGAPALGGDKTPLWEGIVISIGAGLFLAIVFHFIIVPFIIKKRLDKWEEDQKNKEAKKKAIELEEQGAAASAAASADDAAAAPEYSAEDGKEAPEVDPTLSRKPSTLPLTANTSTTTSAADRERAQAKGLKRLYLNHKDRLTGKALHDSAQESEVVQDVWANAEVFDAKTERMYTYLQVITAIFDSFAHGANDVANSIAPFAAIYAVYSTGDIPSKSPVPVWILAMGGAGIVTGLVLYGYRIIIALGMSLTKITPSRGFAIELGTAFTVVVFSLLKVPISTTHCQVGSTSAIGFFDGIKGVNLKLLGITFLGWVITMVFSGAVAALLFAFAAYSPFIPF